MMFLEKNSALIFIIFLALMAGCGQVGISWNPDFHVASYYEEICDGPAIVNEDGIVVCAESQDFDNFACLRTEKIMELAEILRRARIPKKTKYQILNNFDKKTRHLLKSLDAL